MTTDPEQGQFEFFLSGSSQPTVESPSKSHQKINIVRRNCKSADTRALKEKLAHGISKVYSALPEKDRLDESVLYALFLTNSSFSYKVPTPLLLALKPKARSQKPLSLKPIIKKRRFGRHVNIDSLGRHESKKSKKIHQSTVIVDSNGAPLRRTEDAENEKEQAEEDKFIRLAARLPEIKDPASEPEVRDMEELLIDPEDVARLDENDVKRYLAACELKTGANSHIAMVHLHHCGYDLRKAMEAADDPESFLWKTIEAMSWNSSDLLTLSRAIGTRKNHKSMTLIARKMPSKGKQYKDVVTAYYDLKKKTCSVGKDFQLCESVIKDDFPSYDFKFCKSRECDNCVKKLWEFSEGESSKPSLCSLCGLYFNLFHKHRPNAKPTDPIYDTSEIEHPLSCRYTGRWSYEPDPVKPNFHILNQNIYCVRGRDLHSFFSSIKDRCRISKKAWSILRVKEQQDFKEVYLFSSGKKLFNEDESNDFGFYFYDLNIKSDLVDESDFPWSKERNNGRRTKSLSFEFSESEDNQLRKNEVFKENGDNIQEEMMEKNVELIKQESEGIDSGMDMDVSLPLTQESFEDEVFELPEMDSTLTPEVVNDVEMVPVSENILENQEPEKELVTVIDFSKPLSINGSEREDASPELDSTFPTTMKKEESSETNSPSSMKNCTESEDDVDMCTSWKVIASDGNVYDINKEEEREILVKPEISNFRRKEKLDEYELYYLGRKSDDGGMIFDYGNDFYALYQKRLSARKNVFSSMPAEKISKKKLIEGRNPEEWLRESHLQKSYLEFINDFRGCKRKFANLADKYGTSIAAVRSFCYVNNGSGGLQRMFIASDNKNKNRRVKKTRKSEVKMEIEIPKHEVVDEEAAECFASAFEEICPDSE
ncbi:hypothetical protein FO519_001293 [Halicephalobus sp. NKZ332]|nr:hypothetical protein FO519_001293 [Halicephalobus sp. NKZ332]